MYRIFEIGFSEIVLDFQKLYWIVEIIDCIAFSENCIGFSEILLGFCRNCFIGLFSETVLVGFSEIAYRGFC